MPDIKIKGIIFFLSSKRPNSRDPERVKYHSHGCNPWLKKNYPRGFGAHFCFFTKIVTKPLMLKRFLIDYFWNSDKVELIIGIWENAFDICDPYPFIAKRCLVG
jgi:hypothetical protein